MSSVFAHVSYTEKERIPEMVFPREEVLHNSEAIDRRVELVDQAIDAGNFAQFKVMILFEDDHEICEVETTIWDRDSENVYLKNHVAIPINRIHKLRFT